MFRNMFMLTLGFILFMATLNCADAVDQDYIVSFVAGQTRLGLVYVKQSDTGIQAKQASITPMGKTIESTAVITLYGAWDYGFWIEVFTTHAGNAPMPLGLGHFQFDWKLQRMPDLKVIPGAYHPLHAFRYDPFTDSGTANRGYLLTTGTFGTSGANNYVSYLIDSKIKTRIFENPDDRSAGTAAVSPDGGLVSQMTFKGLNHIGLVVKLIDGQLAGSPFQWLNVNAFQGYSQSLSNPIGSNNSGAAAPDTGTRYLAYRNFRQPGTSNSQSRVMIQKVDAKTGRPQGSPRSITNFARAMNVDAEKFQSIAISPDGGLILYTAWSNECSKQLLFARQLVNGSSVGNPWVIVGCGQLEEYPVGVYGINITPAPF